MHVFGDACNDGYGCVAYVVTEGHATLLFARGHANSNRALTIPRLELEAAIMVSLMVTRLKKLLGLALEQFYQWSDSLPVIYIIKAPHRKLDDYTSRKAAQIRACTTIANWRHIPTGDNPADILSRGASMKELLKCSLWWSGPEFLKNGCWPEVKVSPEEDVLVENPAVWEKLMAFSAKDRLTEEIQHVDVFEQISTLTRLVRVFRTWLRILHFLRKGVLVARSQYGWKDGFRVAILWHQRQAFSAERGRPPTRNKTSRSYL